MSVSINGTGGITFADTSTQNTGGYTGFRNRIINGAMMIDQRNAGASVTSNNSGAYGVDRFFTEAYGGGTLSSQQSSTVPAGFKNSLLITVTGTDTSLGTNDDYEVSQKIEGFNCADLGFGAAGASTVTLSFWVRSSVTGTYSVGFQNADATRSYVGTYTINSANTWEQKSITVAGDTSGTWNTGNSTGLFLRWCLATGTNRVASAANTWESANRIAVSATANPVMGTNGATFYITGVQLEKGSVATPFEFRPYGQELALCQRYYFKNSYQTAFTRFANGLLASASDVDGLLMPLPVAMRAQPTIAYLNCAVWDGSASNSITAITANYSTSVSANFRATTSGMTAGRYCQLHSGSNTDAFVSASAEL